MIAVGGYIGLFALFGGMIFGMPGKGVSRVLIVEDDDMVRGFLSRVLEREGYQPLGVRTGEEALSHIRTPPGVDAVLIDGILPDMHGVRLAYSILDEPTGTLVPICFVTGALRDAKELVAGVGALGKPVRLADLTGVVEMMMGWRTRGGSPIENRREALRRMEQGFLVGP